MNLGDSRLALVIDDDPDQLDLVRIAADHAGGIRVIGCQSGAQAMSQLDTWQSLHLPAPDLVLTDLKMPGMSGVQLMQALRVRSDMKNVPVFFLTATDYNRDRHLVEMAGAHGFFQKPVRFDGLVALMHVLLSHVSHRFEGNVEAAVALGALALPSGE